MTEIQRNIQKPKVRKEQKPFRITKPYMSGFLVQMRKHGRSEGTVRKYAADLNRFYEFLDEEKWLYPDSLPRWRDQMVEKGYAARSVNASVVAVNSFYDYLGCWEWKLFEWEELRAPEGPELTREEYLRLLGAAKRQENMQLYLLIKTLAQTELTPGDISSLTREAVEKGSVELMKYGDVRRFVLPEGLQDELLRFAVYRSIRSGPLFLNNSGNAYNRAALTHMIADLGEEIGLETGKANPRNLRRMYQDTMEQFRCRAEEWIIESYATLLQREEEAAGWHMA